MCRFACAARVQWDLACVSRKGSESRVVPACAREGVSTLGELPFRAGNNGMRVAILPSPRSPHKRMWKRRWFSFPSTRWLASFVNTSKGEQRGGRDEFVSARLRSTFQKYWRSFVRSLLRETEHQFNCFLFVKCCETWCIFDWVRICTYVRKLWAYELRFVWRIKIMRKIFIRLITILIFCNDKTQVENV